MRKTLLAAALLGLAGCNWWYNDVPSPDDAMKAVPWFDHMVLSKAAHPYQSAEIPRRTPAGAVPLGGAERDYHIGDPYGAIPSFGFDTVYGKSVQRPAGPPAPGARSGEELFTTFCSACHGFGWLGDAPASALGVGAPSLLTPQASGYSDGFIYSIVKYGRGRMPQYGDKIVRADERWAVVDYLRKLQGKAPAGGAQ